MTERRGGLTTKPDLLIDSQKVNAKYAQYRDDPRRIFTGTTQLPVDMSREQRQRALYFAAGQFIEAMHKKGWDLMGKIHVGRPRTAYDLLTGLPNLGTQEFRIRGLFKMAKTPKPVRIDIPAGIVRRYPDQTITSHEAYKAIH